MSLYISKRVAIIAKEHGFHEEVDSYYIEDFNRLHGSSEDNWNQYNETYSAPLYQQLVEWIFNRFIQSTNEPHWLVEKTKWLEFWYNTLIPELDDNEFVLEGFIGMLLNWFEKHGTINNYNDMNIYFHHDGDWEYAVEYKDSIHYCTKRDTKIEARHEGILKCFELMKGE